MVYLDYLKPELIISESQPIQLPADVVRGITFFVVLVTDKSMISLRLQRVRPLLVTVWMN